MPGGTPTIVRQTVCAQLSRKPSAMEQATPRTRALPAHVVRNRPQEKYEQALSPCSPALPTFVGPSSRKQNRMSLADRADRGRVGHFRGFCFRQRFFTVEMFSLAGVVIRFVFRRFANYAGLRAMGPAPGTQIGDFSQPDRVPVLIASAGNVAGRPVSSQIDSRLCSARWGLGICRSTISGAPFLDCSKVVSSSPLS